MRTHLLLEASGVVKHYGAVRALRGASLAVRPGEVHALLGANGAGKSTLVKVLTGTVRPTAGRIRVRGEVREARSPAAARRAGIACVHQEPSLVPDLDVGSNLRLTGTPPAAFERWMGALGVPLADRSALARDLPLAALHVIDLARALAAEPDVLLLDEMTAALPADLSRRVLDLVNGYRKTGRSVVYISHRLAEVGSVCDRATVLRDGETVGVLDMGAGTEEEIVALMLGGGPGEGAPRARGARGGEASRGDRTGEAVRVKGARQAGGARGDRAAAPPEAASGPREAEGVPRVRGRAPPRLEARALRQGRKLRGVSLALHPGEVLGVVGLEGQGQDPLFEVLAGARRPDGGEVRVDGRPVRFRHPADAIAAGIVLVPANRAEALLMQRSIRENVALPFPARVRRWGPIDMGGERRKVDGAVERLRVDTRAQSEVRRLSGGNQQKVTIARWVAAGADTLLFFDPTRGIDIRTKRQIYGLVRELAAAGAAVLLYTSELEEAPAVCDRVLVIFGGEIVDELPAREASESALLRAAHGLPGSAEAAGTEAGSGHGAEGRAAASAAPAASSVRPAAGLPGASV